MKWDGVRPRKVEGRPKRGTVASKVHRPLWLFILFFPAFSIYSLERSITRDFTNETMGDCRYCHLDSRAEGIETDSPKWNSRNAAGSYRTYGSPTMQASVGQPGEVSVLCLSCHDGSFAADAHNFVRMKRSQMIGANGLMDDHPISFTFDFALVTQDRGLNPPAITPSGLGGTIAKDLLIDDRVECASCHDIHKPSSFGYYLRLPMADSRLCLTCHNK